MAKHRTQILKWKYVKVEHSQACFLFHYKLHNNIENAFGSNRIFNAVATRATLW